MDRATLIQNAIKKAYENQSKRTIVTHHDNEIDTITTFYKKGNAIWCKMVTGCITTENRVYKVNTDEPYIRDMGRYWKLTGEELEIVKRMSAN